MGKCSKCKRYVCKCGIRLIYVLMYMYEDDFVEFAVDTLQKAIDYCNNHHGYTYREIELR